MNQKEADSLKIHCPSCGSIYWVEKTDEYWANCEECGFEQYDDWTVSIVAEVKREQAKAKSVLGYIPDYREAVEKGFCKP